MHRKKPRHPILNPQFLVLSVALIGVTLWMSLITYDSLKAQMTQSLRDQANVIAQNIGPALQFEDQTTAQTILDSLKNNPAIAGASLLTADQLIYVSWQNPTTTPKQPDTLTQTIQVNDQIIGELSLIPDYSQVNKRVMTNLAMTLVAVLLTLIAGFAILQKVQTALKKSQEQLYLQANFDSLTQLPNRFAFMIDLSDQLAHLRNPASQLQLFILDLDNFKRINDTHGHNMGDRLLIAVTQRLKACLPKHWQLYRLGSDEFTVLSQRTSQASNPLEQAQTFMRAIQEPFHIHSYEFYVSLSIGISQAPLDGDTAEALLRSADTALHQVKSQQKGQVLSFHPNMMTHIQNKLNTENALRRAIEQNELRLYYQPQVSLSTHKITGVEALIRWQTPEKLIFPDDFIPLAEETGLILAIGEWALYEGAKTRKAWLDAGINDLVMAINLSGQQLIQQDLPTLLEKVLAQTQLPPHLLELEITESMLMQDLKKVIIDLQKIRQMGVKIAIDDFGTGYSSIAYLKQLPIDVLKIDRSFVKDLDHDQNDRSIIKAILQLSKNLGMTPLAEGVECAAHEAYLIEHGCSRAQGYFYSRPLPQADALAYLTRQGASEPNHLAR